MTRLVPVLVLVMMILTSCVVSMFSPSGFTDPKVIKAFKQAQAQVAKQYPDAGDPYSVLVSGFRWTYRDGPFNCGSHMVTTGCFRAPNKVDWHQAGALYHESGHAILYALGDPRWRCSFSGHSSYKECL